MDLLNSLFVSVFGMSVVFFALVLLIVMINVMSAGVRKSTVRQAAKDKAAAEAAKASVTRSAAAAPQVSAPSVSASSGDQGKMVSIYSGPPELKLTGVDERTAAMIMAIICDESGVAANELYFKSIKALD